MSNNAFLVRLSVSVWTARKLDKDATRKAKADANASDKAGVKLYKSVIAADELDAIHQIANAARVEHRKRTVPWSYDGPGAITAEGYPAYKTAMAGLEKEFYAAVSRFYAVYADERVKAQNYLGNLFNPLDYPSTDSLHERFSFATYAEPMPDAQDFRVGNLAPELVAEIQEKIEDNKANALDNANKTAWQRVIEHVEKLKLKLAGYKPANGNGDKCEGKFHDTLIDNIVELADLIPSINVANDPDLARMQQKLISLTAYTAQELREDDNLRASMVKQAGLVLDGINVAYKQAA